MATETNGTDTDLIYRYTTLPCDDGTKLHVSWQEVSHPVTKGGSGRVYRTTPLMVVAEKEE